VLLPVMLPPERTTDSAAGMQTHIHEKGSMQCVVTRQQVQVCQASLSKLTTPHICMFCHI